MTAAPSYGGETRRRVREDILVGLPVTLAVGSATWMVLDLDATFPAKVAALYLVAAGLILATLPQALPRARFGTANRITLGRLVVVLTLAGLAVESGSLGVAGRWWVIALGTVAMVLDGFDGRAARREGATTPWGGRFDMETDAFLMLVLSALVWTEGRAGSWVLLIGAMRYLFIAGGSAVPALAGDLPESFRRKVVCVVQGIALLVCLGPIIPAPLAVAVAAVALALLVWSFAVDTVWLLGAGRAVPQRAPRE